MMMPHTVEIQRAVSEPDRYGTLVATTWETIATVAGFVQPRGSEEDTDEAEIQITTGRCFLPPGTDVKGSDRILALSRTWEVVGPPDNWQVGLLLDHVRANIRVIEG